MKLQPLTDSVIDLNFKPIEDLSEQLPSIVWQNYRIAGFYQMNSAVYYPKNHPLEVLLSVYKELSLPELARLHKELSENKITFDWESFLKNRNLKWTQDLENLFAVLAETKLSFQNWVSQKGCGLQELQVLTWAFKNNAAQKNELHDFLKFFSALNPSRQTGCKILEYYFELMPTLDGGGISKHSDPEKLLLYLKEKKFPDTFQKDEDLKYKVQQVPWPAHVKAQFTRNGDRSGIEVRFFCTSAEDYNKKTNGLTQVQEQIKNKVWNPS